MRAEPPASKRSVPTDQELSVLLAVVEHGGVKLAARELDLSVHTIRTYLARLRDKSGRSTLAQVLLWAQVQSASVRSKLVEAPQLPDEEVAMRTAESPWKGLSEAQWATISAYLPAEKKGPGRHRLDRRTIVNGILYKLRTGCSWEHLPEEFGNRSTCSRCWREWKEDGTWGIIWKQFYETLSRSERQEWGLLLLERGWIPEIGSR